MVDNPVLQTLLSHRSVRKFKSDQPTDEIIETIVRAGQQAPFASQLYSVLLARRKKSSIRSTVMVHHLRGSVQIGAFYAPALLESGFQ